MRTNDLLPQKRNRDQEPPLIDQKWGKGKQRERKFLQNKRTWIHQTCFLKNVSAFLSLLPQQRIWILWSDSSHFTKCNLSECSEKKRNIDKALKRKGLSQNDSLICFTIFNLIKNYLIISCLNKNGSVSKLFYNHVVY